MTVWVGSYLLLSHFFFQHLGFDDFFGHLRAAIFHSQLRLCQPLPAAELSVSAFGLQLNPKITLRPNAFALRPLFHQQL